MSASKNTQLRVKDGDTEYHLGQQLTDAPLMPVAQLEQLHNFRPDRVDFVFDQTQFEAEFRREETKKNNQRAFYDVVIGHSVIFSVAVGSIFAGYQVMMNGMWQGVFIPLLGIGLMVSLVLKK